MKILNFKIIGINCIQVKLQEISDFVFFNSQCKVTKNTVLCHPVM